VHYAAASGAITSLLDRSFFAGSEAFAYKPGAAVVCCRRGGATAAFEQLNKYFTINNMPVVSSQYWNMVHGNNPEEAKQDLEGMQIMRTLGKNMAWLLKCIEAGKAAGIDLPEKEKRAISKNWREKISELSVKARMEQGDWSGAWMEIARRVVNDPSRIKASWRMVRDIRSRAEHA
jgi:hypothetical protein